MIKTQAIKLKNKTSPIEIQIVDLFNKGDMQCLTLINDHYSSTIFGIAIKYMDDIDAAKEVVQETLIKVWRHHAKYDSSKASLFTWLYRIVKNTSYDKLRTRKLKVSREIRDEITLVDNFKSTSMNTDVLDLPKHLDTLKVEYRKVIEMYYYMGMTEEQVGDALEIPLGTVKSRRRIGLRELRIIYSVK